VPKGITSFGEIGGGYNQGGLFFGGGAVANLAYATMTAEIGNTANDGFVWGMSLAANLLRGSLETVSVSVQTGYGMYSPGGSEASPDQARIPFGVALALEYDQAGFDIEPWAGVRGELVREQFPNGVSRSDVGYGISAGVYVRSTALRRVIGLPNKFGIHVSADLLSVPDHPNLDLAVSGAIGISYGIFPMKSLPDHGIFGRRAEDACGPFDPC
jgi:hypothetical protein